MSTPTPGTPEALEQQVERDREQLADTVDALQAKLDVKAHAKQRAARVKASVTDASGRPRPVVLGVAAVVVVGVTVLVWRRTRG